VPVLVIGYNKQQVKLSPQQINYIKQYIRSDRARLEHLIANMGDVGQIVNNTSCQARLLRV